jgi:hypothetical protein
MYPTHRFLALSHDFAIVASEARIARYLDDLFRAFARDGIPARQYRLETSPQGQYRSYTLFENGAEILPAQRADDLLSGISGVINAAAILSSRNRSIVVHAAAAAYQGTAVILPGPSGSGKSTLVAGLIQQGLGYLTDEAVAINPDTLEIDPYPKPLSIKPGTQAILPDLAPAPAHLPHEYVGKNWELAPEWIDSDAVSEACTPSLIVAPTFATGATTQLRTLAPTRALLLLLQTSLIRGASRAHAFRALGELANRVESYELRFGELQDACATIVELLHTSGTRSPVGYRSRLISR